MKEKKLGARFWFAILLVGVIGQLAWAIENNYINLWVYSQTQNTDSITLMTVTSALAATLATFFIGLLSDRVGKRKIFINVCYIIWGVTVFAFGLFSYHNMLNLTKDQATAILLVGVFMTAMDIVMTFFGSSGNDAAFNAWLTEHTETHNRGKVESVVSILPLFANVLMLGIGIPFHIGAVPDEFLKGQIEAGVYPDSQAGLAHGWFYYFLVCGLIVTLVGVISIWLLPKDNCVPNRESSYGRKLIYGFRPSVIKENKEFYLLLVTFFCFNSAVNSFMPYYLVYFQNPVENYGAGFGSGIDFYVAFAIILIVSSLLTVLMGIFLMNRINRTLLFFVGLGIGSIGALGAFLVGSFALNRPLMVALGTALILGYLICTAVLGAGIRDKTPERDVGLFQGVRMIFVVLLPMVTGPLISQALFPTAEFDPNNPTLAGKQPSPVMFLVTLGFFLLSAVPMLFLRQVQKKNPPEVKE